MHQNRYKESSEWKEKREEKKTYLGTLQKSFKKIRGAEK